MAVLVVVVICLVGQLACSGLGIFFAGEDSGTGRTVTTAVQEIDLEFGNRLAEIQASKVIQLGTGVGRSGMWWEIL